MTCESQSVVTLEWPRTGLEIEPYSVSIESSLNQLDFLRATCSREVGEYLKPHTKGFGRLRYPQEVHVKLDGEQLYHLYFRPKYVEYGTAKCWIELHDPQKHMAGYTIDQKWPNITLKEAYKAIFNAARLNDGSIVRDIRFGIPAEQKVSMPNQLGQGTVTAREWASVNKVDSSVVSDLVTGKYVQNTMFTTTKILEGSYNIDLEDMTCLEALWTLNDEFGLTSWMNGRDGNLWIGQPDTSTVHLAAPDDRRVWKWDDVSINHPPDPIQKVILKGRMVDSPNDHTLVDTGEAIVGFLSLDKSIDEHKDLMPQGIAERENISNGQTIVATKKGARSDSLESIAYQIMRNEIRKQNSGTVSVTPKMSGAMRSEFKDVRVGDHLHLIPEEGSEEQMCGSGVKQELYVITGVNHEFDGPDWSGELEVAMLPDVDITTDLQYYDPLYDDYLDENYNIIEGWEQ